MRGQEGDHLARVLDVPRHAQRQGFDALQDQPGGVRAHAGAEVAQALAAGAQQERADAAFLAEHHAVEAGVGLVQFGKTRRGVPVEQAAVDQHATDHGAVAGQELGRRMEHQVGAVFEGFHQPRRGEGGVDQQRQSGLVGDRADGGNVQHVQPRVAQRFAEQQLGVGADRRAPGVDVAGLTKVVPMPKRFSVKCSRLCEPPYSADEATMCEPAPARVAMARCSAAWPLAVAIAPHAAFERRDALFQHRVGGVADAAVHMARAFHVEQAGGVLAAVEDEAGATARSAPRAHRWPRRAPRRRAAPGCRNRGRRIRAWLLLQ